MKTMKKSGQGVFFRALLLLASVLVCSETAGQVRNVQVYPSRYNVGQGDPVVFRIGDHQGDVQWQRSTDGVQWTDVDGATLNDLSWQADQSAFFRAKVIAGFCDPFYSAKAGVNVYRLKEQAIRSRDIDAQMISTEQQIAQGLYVFQGNHMTSLQTGMYITGEEGMGYIRKITGVSLSGGNTHLTTAKARLTDILSFVSLADSVELFPPGKKLDLEGEPDATTNLSGMVIEIQAIDVITGNEGTVRLDINQGETSFSPWFFRTMELDDQSTDHLQLELATGGKLTLELEAALSSDIRTGMLHSEKNLFTLVFGPVMTGPVPMYLEYALTLELQAEFDEPGSMSFEAGASYDLLSGAKYHGKGSGMWEPLFSSNMSSATATASHELGGPSFVTVTIKPMFRVILAGEEGPAFGTETFLRAGLHTEFADWKLGVTSGSGASMAFSMDGFDDGIEDFIGAIPVHGLTLFETDGSFEVPENHVVDYDGNMYRTVVIDGRRWMAENLQSLRYSDGSPIEGVYAYDNEEGNASIYGRLYTWEAGMRGSDASGGIPSGVQGVCPPGWHIPSFKEWGDLANAMPGTIDKAASFLKDCRQVNSPLGGDCNTAIHPRWDANANHHGTDEFGFSGLPGGNRRTDGNFMNKGRLGVWMTTETTTHENVEMMRTRIMTASNSFLSNSTHTEKSAAISIRCVEDFAPPPPPPGYPKVETTIVEGLTYHSATIGGVIVDDGGSPVTEYGLRILLPGKGWETIPLGQGTGSFSMKLENLLSERQIRYYAYAINQVGIVYGAVLEFYTLISDIGRGCDQITTVYDIDNNQYTVVEIGKQCWFTTNLRVGRYRNGTVIPRPVGDNQIWLTNTDGLRAWYNDDAANWELYGTLYNWYAVNNPAGLCPPGWRVPTDADWRQLRNFVDPDQNEAGGKLKSTQTYPAPHPRWDAPNTGATNEFGFAGMPGGIRFAEPHLGHYYLSRGTTGLWWAADLHETGPPNTLFLGTNFKNLIHDKHSPGMALSVRCIRE